MDVFLKFLGQSPSLKRLTGFWGTSVKFYEHSSSETNQSISMAFRIDLKFGTKSAQCQFSKEILTINQVIYNWKFKAFVYCTYHTVWGHLGKDKCSVFLALTTVWCPLDRMNKNHVLNFYMVIFYYAIIIVYLCIIWSSKNNSCNLIIVWLANNDSSRYINLR